MTSPYPKARESIKLDDPLSTPFVISLSVESARSLIAADSNGFSDPYVCIEARTDAGVLVKKLKTSIIRKSLDPSWTRSFRFRARGASVLRFTVMDADAIGSDDFLGRTEININDLLSREVSRGKSNVSVDDWFALENNHGVTGENGDIKLAVQIETRAVYAADPSAGFDGSSSDGEAGFVASCMQRGAHAGAVISDAAAEEINALKERCRELTDKLEEATRREREMIKKFAEEKKALAKDYWREKRLQIEASASRKVSKVVDKVLDKTADLIKDKVKDPDMPKFVHRVIDHTIDEAMPDVKSEVVEKVTAVIRTKAEIDLGEPISVCPNPYAWVRAWVLYTLFPFDRSVWQKIRTPGFWLLTLVSLFPRYGVQQLWFLFLLIVKDKSDEYTLIQFILAFKSLQFVSGGIVKTIVASIQYWQCANDVNSLCKDDGPTIEYFEVGFFITQIFLVWTAFALLPYSKKKGGIAYVPAKGEIVDEEGKPGCCGKTKYQNRGGRLLSFVIYDTAIFVIAIGVLAWLTFVNDATKIDLADEDDFKEHEWLLKANIHWVMVFYSLLSFPFAIFKLPVLYGLLTHAKPTGYSRWGKTVPLQKAPRDDDNDADDGNGRGKASESESDEPLLRRLMSKVNLFSDSDDDSDDDS